MLIIALALLLLGLALLLVALRGRIVDRGSFCRRCRFDLAGLAPDAPACPECGGDLAAPNASRPTLRRRRPIVLALGIVLLLSGGTLMGIIVSNNQARVMAVLPDRIVLTLHALGMDAAFTDIATSRLVRKPPLSDDAWDDLIANAIAHQQDISTLWDPRHGEVLANALVDGRLTQEQASAYVRLAIDSAADFPETLRHGATIAGLNVRHTNSARIAALNRFGAVNYGPEKLRLWMTITRAGTVDPDYEAQLNSTYGGMFTVPDTGPRTGGGSDAQLPLEELDWSKIEPNSEITLIVE
ncbi:MAG: hypothetical protein WD114_03915 [Phycisphaerales bacterium]